MDLLLLVPLTVVWNPCYALSKLKRNKYDDEVPEN